MCYRLPAVVTDGDICYIEASEVRLAKILGACNLILAELGKPSEEWRIRRGYKVQPSAALCTPKRTRNKSLPKTTRPARLAHGKGEGINPTKFLFLVFK
jgi:hypothetical protein